MSIKYVSSFDVFLCLLPLILDYFVDDALFSGFYLFFVMFSVVLAILIYVVLFASFSVLDVILADICCCV